MKELLEHPTCYRHVVGGVIFCKVTSIFLDAMLALPNHSVASGVKTTASDKVRGMQAAVIFTARSSRMAGWRH